MSQQISNDACSLSNNDVSLIFTLFKFVFRPISMVIMNSFLTARHVVPSIIV